MSAAKEKLLSFSEARERQRSHPLRTYEIPVEHAVSLPLPTRRWGTPAYASFASPALRRPGQPVEQGAPDRWWAVGAHGGRLIIYALWKAAQYADGVNWTTVALPQVTATIAELKEALSRIEELMDALVQAFFAGEGGDVQGRKALSDALEAYLPEPIKLQYRALAPDFFAWLEA